MSTLGLPSTGEAMLYLRQQGVRRAWSTLVARYLMGRQQWYLTIEDLRQWIGLPVEADPYEIRAARVDDIPRMEAFGARQHRHTLERWCDDDHVLFIALAGGRAIAYRCVSREIHHDLASVMRLGPDQLFVVDEYTVPEFRRRGITRQLAIAMNPELIARGFHQVVGVHRTDNHDTIAATRRKNIQTLGTLTRCRLGWSVWFIWTPLVTGVEPPLSLATLGFHRVGAVEGPASAV